MTHEDEQPLSRFRSIFDAHYGQISAYARRRCASPEDADDAVAETFTVAWRKLPSVPRDDALPWLFAVARKVIANQRRGLMRRSRLVAGLRTEPRTSGAALEGEPVRQALARLRPDDRELLRLVAWEGLAHSQVAAAMGISTNAVAIRLHRARSRLRQQLERAGFGPNTRSMAGGHPAR